MTRRARYGDAALVLALFLFLWAAAVAGEEQWRIPGSWAVLVTLGWALMAAAHPLWPRHSGWHG